MESTVILNGIISGIIRSLADGGIAMIIKVACVKKDVDILARRLESIMAVIGDAEGHRILAQSEAADHRLKKLREIAYEAETIIDLFRIEVGTSRSQEWDAASICKCVKEVHIRCQIGNDIQELNRKLNTIIPAIQQLGLATEDQSGIDSEVAPHHNESNTIGRGVGSDCNDLVNLLRRGGEGAHVLFAIVGTIGVGKSTLARKIYHEMRGRFRIRLWVNISNDSRHITIWSGERFKRRAGMSEQREVLRNYLNGSTRNLLLVIDNVSKADDWNQLLAANEAFRRCGCKVIVTTRDENVARTMGVTHFHRVKCLNGDDGWLLLHKTANLGGTVTTRNIQDVGRSIVQKCSGVPMAIRTIGWNLRGRSREDEWESIHSQDLISSYPGIRDSIDTTYMELKYRHKRCFLYCSLYPEKFVIKQQCATQQWIAEGFFEGSGNLEKAAGRCYQELIERGLLLPEHEADGVVGAKMPTLLRSFALYRSGDENCVDNLSRISSTSKPWRLCITAEEAIEAIPVYVTRLRTLFVSARPLSRSSLDLIIERFPNLRVLDLRDTQVETIPKTLGRLLQLRYLNLSNTKIRKLPRNIGNLMMLQFLILQNCPCLTQITSHVGRLVNLRGLDFSGAPELNDIRFRLLKLTGLNCLHGFFPANHGWTLVGLCALRNLTSLQILRLGRASSIEDAQQSRLQDMDNLRELELCCSSVDQPPVGIQEHMKDVFSALRPPQSLASLKLDGYYGNGFPAWFSVSHLTVLQRLTLDGCVHCQRLPALGEMMNLKFLAIIGFSVLTEINYELRGAPATGVAFPMLEQLFLGRMQNMVSWSGLVDTDMPLLERLHLDGCPRMISVPSWLQHCTTLKSLKIHHADALQNIENLPALKELQVHDSSNLKRVFNLRRLEDLKIVNCACLSIVQDVPLLCILRLDLDEHTSQLPEWLQRKQPFTLRRLEIVGSEDLLDRCSSSTARYGRLIKDAADHVYAKLHGGSLYFSYTKSTGMFDRSRRCRDRSSMQSAAILAVPVAPRRVHGGWETWIKYTLCAIFLIVSQFFVQWAVSSR
ncbi:disease resistance protein RGA2-like [Hordeum vulgare subsp. vulgare]|nr:disease resistance protein RGA2-like [Hordeum vulgare subsp. vulgare]